LLGGSAGGAHRLDEAAQREAWARLDAEVDAEDGDTVLRAGTLPSRLPEVALALAAAAAASGVDATLVSSVACGVHTARVRSSDTAAHRAFITQWREAVHALGGSVTLRRRADGVDRDFECWGPAPSAVAVMRRVKQQFDPQNRCNPGRFTPWF
jgi:glycolate oxidase FAD binding subunit